MKKLLVIALMAVGTAAFAQVSSGEIKMMPDNAKIIEVQSQKMKTYLGLNDDQTIQIKALLTTQVQKQEAKKTETQTATAQLTEAQKTELKTKMEAERMAMNSQLQLILTPEQYTKWLSTIATKQGKF